MKKSVMSFIQFNRKAILLLSAVVSFGVFGSSAAGSSFATWVDYTTGLAPYSVATGDFNGDGNLDLAVANNSGQSVSVMLGLGHGTFTSKVDYPTGTGTTPSSVALGDFNGDGNLDLVVANNDTSNTVSVLLGTGTGTFGAEVQYPTGARAASVAVGDFNADGKQDLAVTDFDGNTVSVLLGSGTGAFGAKVDYPTLFRPLSVSVGDFNGDGKPDLVVTSYESLSVLLNAGGGTFSPKIDYTFPPGYDIEYLAVRDLNGDGKLDLAVATGQTVAILMGTGSGTFAAAVEYATGGATSVAIADLDGDGNPDLAIGSRSDPYISFLPGNGDGTFGAFVLNRVNFNPRSVAVGDFNDDGKPDLVSTAQSNNSVSVLLNTAIFPSPTPSNFCGEITGRISDSGGSLQEALVEACDTNNVCAFNAATDAAGNYRILGLPPNTSYDLTVNPPSNSTDLPAKLPGRSVQSCSIPLAGQNAVLVTPGPPPPGTTIQPSTGEIPVVNQNNPLFLSTTQRSGGTASYRIGRGGSTFSSGSMAESPNGHYTAPVPPLAPAHGPASVTIIILYPDNTTIQVIFDIYIDPSGIVRNTLGQPIQGATVTLYRSDTGTGAYAQVANGNAVMSPGNRQNPDTTNAAGNFGWDVLAGYYKVRAQKNGCNAPGNPSQLFVETAALQIPPPFTDLVLTLECAAASPTPTPNPTPTPQFLLTLSKAGTGTGTVTSSPAGINCGAICTSNYNSGTVVTLTASATAGSTFGGWSGAGCSGTGTCVVTVAAAQTVTATFNAPTPTPTPTPSPTPQFGLSVTKSGGGSGTITSGDGRISCGATCSANYNTGTVVTLTATPGNGSIFAGWSGSCSGTGTCSVTMSQARAVNPAFTLAPTPTPTPTPQFALTVTKNGGGSGTIASGDGRINCGATCSANYNTGTVVTLTATPANGSLFAGWNGSCTGTGTCSITMSQARSVNAAFNLAPTPTPTPTPTPAPTGTVLLGAEMEGSDVVPSVNTNGEGITLATLNRANNKLTIVSSFGPFTSIPTSAHIHGPATTSQNGPMLFDIGPVITGKLGSKWYGATDVKTITLTAAQAQQLMNGQLYVDIHSQNFANGEIRGKIVVLLSSNSQFSYGPTLRAVGDSEGVLRTSDSLLKDVSTQIEKGLLQTKPGSENADILEQWNFRRTNDIQELSLGVEAALSVGIITAESPQKSKPLRR